MKNGSPTLIQEKDGWPTRMEQWSTTQHEGKCRALLVEATRKARGLEGKVPGKGTKGGGRSDSKGAKGKEKSGKGSDGGSKGGEKGKCTVQGNCHNCGNYGHRAAECPEPRHQQGVKHVSDHYQPNGHNFKVFSC